jgi:hypothetical protein
LRINNERCICDIVHSFRHCADQSYKTYEIFYSFSNTVFEGTNNQNETLCTDSDCFFDIRIKCYRTTTDSFVFFFSSCLFCSIIEFTGFT